MKNFTALSVLFLVLSHSGNISARNILKDFTISGPHTHENLTIFLVHGPEDKRGRKVLTLDEAVKQGKVLVHETGNVNQVKVENLSGKEYVLVNSGDIVKGGKQDRTIPNDVLIPPDSGKEQVSAYCVEQGRWQQRGDESEDHFVSAESSLSGKKMRIASTKGVSQELVWKEVVSIQNKLEENVGKPVKDEKSTTSLQLTMENDIIRLVTDSYMQKLLPVIEEHDDLLGYVFVINGGINSADIYSEYSLFRKMWPKLLKSSSVEAISELEGEKESEEPDVDDIQNWLCELEYGREKWKTINERTELMIRESHDNTAFVTYEVIDESEKWLHINFIKN